MGKSRTKPFSISKGSGGLTGQAKRVHHIGSGANRLEVDEFLRTSAFPGGGGGGVTEELFPEGLIFRAALESQINADFAIGSPIGTFTRATGRSFVNSKGFIDFIGSPTGAGNFQTDLDGSADYFTRGADFTGNVDSKQFTISGWVRIDGGDGTVRRIFSSQAGSQSFFLASTNKFRLILKNAVGTELVDVQTTNTFTADGSTWYHVMIAGDFSVPEVKMVINGATETLVESTAPTDDIVDWTKPDWVLGALADGTLKWNGAFSEIYFNPVTYLDPTIGVNLKKFRTNDGQAVALGSDGSLPTGTSPIFYSPRGNGENKGTGGDMAATGAPDTNFDGPSAANQPAFETVNSSLALLIEGSRKNLALKSENFDDDGPWAATNITVTPDAAVAPDGNTTADKLVEASGISLKRIQNIAQIVTADVNTTVSLFVKEAERKWIRVIFGDTAQANGVEVWFDVNAGTKGTAQAIGTGTHTSSSITSMGNGWYRLVVTGKMDAGETVSRLHLTMALADGATTYDGDGSSGLYAWGAQVEDNAAFASSYIPTTTAAVTRNADILHYNKDNVAAITVGTVVVQVTVSSELQTAGTFVGTQDNSGLNGIDLQMRATNRPQALYSDDTTFGVGTVAGDVGDTFTAGTTVSLAQTWETNSLKLYVNGVLSGAPDTSVPISGTFERIGIGNTFPGNSPIFANIKNVEFYNRVLSTAEILSRVGA